MGFHQTYIAGVSYRPGAADRLAELDDGDVLELEREPDNPHDENAVKVMHDGFHVGYVPRDLAPEIGKLIAEGRADVAVKRKSNKIEIPYTAKEETAQS